MNKLRQRKVSYSFGHKYLLGLFALFFFALAFGVQFIFTQQHQVKHVVHRVQTHFSRLEYTGKNEFSKICRQLCEMEDLSEFSIVIDSMKDQHLLGDVLLMQDDSLVYYSNHALCFDQAYSSFDTICTLPNGVYWQQNLIHQDFHLRYLIPLKHSFAIKNAYLNNSYPSALNIPDGYAINENNAGFPIYFSSGKQAFSLQQQNLQTLPYKGQLLVSLIFTIAFILLINFIASFIRRLSIPVFFKIFGVLLLFSLLYFLHLKTHFPHVIWEIKLAQPTVFADSCFFPSITTLFLFCVLCLTFSLFICRLIRKNTLSRWLVFALLAMLLASYIGMSYLIKALVFSSSFSMQLNQVNHLSIAGIIAYLCISMLFLACFILQLKILANRQVGKQKIWKISILSIGFMIVLGFMISWNENIYLIALFVLSNLLIILFSESEVKRGSIFYLISFTALYALFTLVVLQNYQEKQVQQLRDLYAYNKYEGHDAETELVFKDIEAGIKNDSIIPDKMLSGDFKFIEDYVEHEYLDNIGSKYHIWLSICSPTDKLLIEPEDTYTPCYAFFDKMLQSAGTLIPKSNFYYVDTPNGLLSYFGKFTFHPSPDKEYTLFLQLEAKMKEEGLGFPELLTDESQLEPKKYNSFSFAKYHNNQLISVGGDYAYSFDIGSEVQNLSSGITHLKKNKYLHSIYKNSRGDIIVVSSPNRKIWQNIFSFPYIFLLYLLIALGVVFFGSIKDRRELFNYDLSTRIQLAIIGMLFLSLILVSTATVWYNLRQYQKGHRNDLNEKMNAISQELNYQLSDVQDIHAIQENTIWENLGNWSNVFQTDINIYETDGSLLASSRPALFNLGLSSRQMNSRALHRFNRYKNLDLIQPENIGKLQFLSAYQAVMNERGETVCYINLPYFMRSDSLRQDMLNFIVAFINLSVFLLFISIMAALALSNRITKPLSHIKESLRDMSISKQNKPISYNGNDEIGELVQEYNNKLTELEESARLLAQSQREMAWKEMARQIAHEIKNPLTPMKLQIQHLQRAKSSGDMDRYNLVFDRVTSTLIEQIDRLTAIANSFSQFAKMPEPQPETLDLPELLQKVILLFESGDNMQLIFRHKVDSPLLIFADNEQLSRAFINIIKNAQQAVPSEKKAIINIELHRINQIVRISIEDNGCGVPDEIATRLFEPNFTTKSGGMGLGLAIVKRSIESAKGKIWFESTKNAGTTFFIELPAL